MGDSIDRVRRTLTDPQRKLWRDDVEGICSSPDMCFEYGETVRCWPCAARQSAAAGIEIDSSTPNSPEAFRLRRELKAARDALTLCANRLDTIVVSMIASGCNARWEVGEWADHARRAALGDNQAQRFDKWPARDRN